jgi:hypothetical protein
MAGGDDNYKGLFGSTIKNYYQQFQRIIWGQKLPKIIKNS